MRNEAWGIDLPPRNTAVIALDYDVRILAVDQICCNFIYAIKIMRQYAIDTFGKWSSEDAAALCGLRESKDFCDAIREKARESTVCNITITLPVGVTISRERAMVTVCAVLGLMGIAYHITAVRERYA